MGGGKRVPSRMLQALGIRPRHRATHQRRPATASVQLDECTSSPIYLSMAVLLLLSWDSE